MYTTYDLLDADAEIVLNGLLKMYQKILAICKKEAAGKLISDEENRWIPVITAELEKYVSVHNGFDAAYTNDDDRTKDGSRHRKGARRFIRCARVSACFTRHRTSFREKAKTTLQVIIFRCFIKRVNASLGSIG